MRSAFVLDAERIIRYYTKAVEWIHKPVLHGSRLSLDLSPRWQTSLLEAFESRSVSDENPKASGNITHKSFMES